jgi:hypothetical protein
MPSANRRGRMVRRIFCQGTPDRYRLQKWRYFLSTELHKQYARLFDAAADEAR